jgi:hypothetical protein
LIASAVDEAEELLWEALDGFAHPGNVFSAGQLSSAALNAAHAQSIRDALVAGVPWSDKDLTDVRIGIHKRLRPMLETAQAMGWILPVGIWLYAIPAASTAREMRRP